MLGCDKRGRASASDSGKSHAPAPPRRPHCKSCRRVAVEEGLSVEGGLELIADLSILPQRIRRNAELGWGITSHLEHGS